MTGPYFERGITLPRRKEHECPQCGKSGTVKWSPAIHRDEDIEVHGECPECGCKLRDLFIFNSREVWNGKGIGWDEVEVAPRIPSQQELDAMEEDYANFRSHAGESLDKAARKW